MSQIYNKRRFCPMRHENGNCLPSGGFCTAVNDPICEGLHNAFEQGKQAEIEHSMFEVLRLTGKHEQEKLNYLREIYERVTENSKNAVEVVRCKDCTYGITDEEEPGMCKCVESAEYDSEYGEWMGFVEYHTPDFYCAFGERKENG